MEKKKRIYTVATAHLDTVWSWDFEETLREYIPRTLLENFEMFEKYPTYRFSFEGAYRYELMQEYYPELFEKLKEYVASGRWSVAGSAYENGDVNVPSPEALFRNILLGNGYFDKTFGKRSCDIFLPDCFGFGWALPSVMRHAHLLGFTTQKLTWGSAYGRPFDVGLWQGVDGQRVYASIDPRSYAADMQDNWNAVEEKLAKAAADGQDFTYLFHGVGDRGGSARERSVAFTEELIKTCDKYEVLASAADEMYRDIERDFSPERKATLPVWNNELVMTDHAVGGYTSRALGKRWNRRCEELADVAERTGVIAAAMQARPYDRAGLNRAWKRFIAHQFHDDLPGTSCQRVYKRSWNDYAVSMNEFATQIEANESAIVQDAVDTSFCSGTPVVVFNHYEQPRKGLVKARIPAFDAPCARAFLEDGTELPCQILKSAADLTEVAFVLDVPAFGCLAVDVRPCADAMTGALAIGDGVLENQRYRVELNDNGDVASVYDKALGRELLAAPVTLSLFNYQGSTAWPAWELRYSEQAKEPDRTAKRVSIEVEASGAAYVAYRVTQRDGDSVFTTVIGLSDGGQAVEVYEEADWRGFETLCKRVFRFTAENAEATYDLGLGAIKRGNMREKLYEVPAQKWADITDKTGEFGISVLSECKYGWDKFDDATLRLTIVHTPQRNYKIDTMQSMMDLGLLRWSFAIMGHAGDVGTATQQQARLFVQPMTAVVTDRHAVSGGVKSFGSLSTDAVLVRAVKLAEDSDEVVVRLNEGTGKAVSGVRFAFGNGILSAREIYADETEKGNAVVENGELVADFAPYQIRSFALKLSEPVLGAGDDESVPVALPLDKRIAARKGETADFELAIPAEQFPETVVFGNATFRPGDGTAMTCASQTIDVPDGADTLLLLCASTDGDRDAAFGLDGKVVTRRVFDAYERFARGDFYDFGQTAYVKKGRIAFEATHSLKDGEVVFAKCQWFYAVELPVTGVKTVTLPADDAIVILAATAVRGDAGRLAYPVYDEIDERPCTFEMSPERKARYDVMKKPEFICDHDGLPEDDGRGIDY